MIKPHHILKLNSIIGARTYYARILGRWFRFQDGKGSKTPAVVYEEIARGYYHPQQKLCAGDTVLDLGAHIGMWTIPLAKTNPEVNFICVEPDPNNFRNLVYNIQRAKVQNVLPLHLGLWSANCEMASVHREDNTGGSHSLPSFVGSCPGMMWHDFRKKFGLQNIKLLKMDIEGAEFHIIRDHTDLEGISEILAEIHGVYGNEYEMATLLGNVKKHRLQLLHANGKTTVYENDNLYRPRDLDNYCARCNRPMNPWNVDLCPGTLLCCTPS